LQKENDEQALPSFYNFLKTLEASDIHSNQYRQPERFLFSEGERGIFAANGSSAEDRHCQMGKGQKDRLCFWPASPILRGLIVPGRSLLRNTKPQSTLTF